MLHLRKVLILVTLIAVGILASELSAQDSGDWKSKVKEIKGEGVKIRIETTEGAYFFDGKEAIDLVKYIKSSNKQLKFITKKIDHDIEFEGDLDSMLTEFIVVDDTSEGMKKIEVNITSSDDEGEQTVIITTDDDGEETVKVLKGENAEEYLEKHMTKGAKSLIKTKVIKLDDDSDSEEHTIWITDDFKDEGALEKEIRIELDSLDSKGANKVTIKTIKDGKKKVKVLKGDEAKEYIKKHGSHKISKNIIMDGDEDGNVFLFSTKDLKNKKKLNWNFVEEEVDGDGNKITKKIKFDVIDGSKKVTVTTVKDGKETVEVLEGKEAVEYLKKHNKGKSLMFISEDGDVTSFDGKVIKVRDSGDGDEIEVEVEVSDDTEVENKVIIKKKK